MAHLRMHSFRRLTRGQWLRLAGILGFWLLVQHAVVGQDAGEVDLRISVTNTAGTNNEAAVQSFKISIPRTGIVDGKSVADLKATVENGILSPDRSKTSLDFTFRDGWLDRPGTGFQLTAKPHVLKVDAEGFPQVQLTIANEDIRKALNSSDHVLLLTVPLVKPPPDGGKGAAHALTPPNTFSSYYTATNFAAWIFAGGLLLAIGFWVFLVIVGKLFRLYRFEELIVRLPAQLARVVVSVFGFRLSFDLLHKSVASPRPPEVLLRNIDEHLNALCSDSAQSMSSPSQVQEVVDSLRELSRSDPAVEAYLNGIQISLSKVSNVRKPQDEQTLTLAQLVDAAVSTKLREAGVGSPNSSVGKEASPAELSPRPSAPPPFEAQLQETNHKAAAKLSYLKLLQHQQPNGAVIFLEADTKSSIMGKLLDDSVYLLQVTSSQAPFALFVDENSNSATGWVFPNPAQGYDRTILKDVFPHLNETQFNDAKESIEPVHVRKDGERRWRVDNSDAANG